MKEVLTELINKMKPQLLAVGVTEQQLSLLLDDDANKPAVYDALIILDRTELLAYRNVLSLVPQSLWDHYAARGIKNLRECKVRAEAEKLVRKAFRMSVAIHARRKPNAQAADTGDAQGVGIQP